MQRSRRFGMVALPPLTRIGHSCARHFALPPLLSINRALHVGSPGRKTAGAPGSRFPGATRLQLRCDIGRKIDRVEDDAVGASLLRQLEADASRPGIGGDLSKPGSRRPVRSGQLRRGFWSPITDSSLMLTRS
jgi:hypothetical protein